MNSQDVQSLVMLAEKNLTPEEYAIFIELLAKACNVDKP